MLNIKKKHNMISTCPKCGSAATGRYIRGNYRDEINIVKKYYKKGERVRITEEPKYHNCYCENCGLEWHEDIIKAEFTKKEWNKLTEDIQLEGKYYNYSLHRRKKRIDKLKEKYQNERNQKIINYCAFFFFGYRFWKKKDTK